MARPLIQLLLLTIMCFLIKRLLREATKNNDMDSFHRHLDELERLLSDDDRKKRRIKESVLCYAAHLGSTPIVEALIQKGVGKKFYNENIMS